MSQSPSNPESHIRVTFCWAEVTSYMAACWRALAKRPGIDVHVVHPQQLSAGVNPFLADPMLLHGISNEMFSASAPKIDRWLLNAVAGRRPHVVVLCGWLYKPYSALSNAEELKPASV